MTLPIGARLADALRNLADQLLSRQFPAHPDFDPDRRGEPVKLAELRTVLDYVRRSVDDPDGRVEVDRRDRQLMRRIANSLRLGEMHEAAFVLGRYWAEHLDRRAAQERVTGDLRAEDLLRWLDEPTTRRPWRAAGAGRPQHALSCRGGAGATGRSLGHP